MSVPLNPRLYAKAKKIANDVYGEQTSAYKSMFMVTTYKRLGGVYSNFKPHRDRGTTRWLREQWIVVKPFLENGIKIPCGVSERRRKHACRPSKRVSPKTPITIQEAINKHGKPVVAKLASKKQKGTETHRVQWDMGTWTKRSRVEKPTHS
jgi:hypothetical protein